MTLREYSGNAKTTLLAGDITNVATSFSVADGTGYPTGATGPFIVTIGVALSSEEKVLCTSRTGNSFTVTTRGYDGTTASAHSNGATVMHTFSAIDAREANAHVNATSGVHGATGAVVGTTDTQTLTNKTLTAPTIADFTNAGHTHTGTSSGGAISGSGTVVAAKVATSQTTASSSYTDLTTAGPAATVTVGASGAVKVTVTALMFNNTVSDKVFMGFAVSGASTVAAADTDALMLRAAEAGQPMQASYTTYVSGLTPGSTTFTAKYRVDAGTGTWQNRQIIVTPL